MSRTANYSKLDPSELGHVCHQLEKRLNLIDEHLASEKLIKQISGPMNKSLPIHLPKVHAYLEEFRDFKEKVTLKLDLPQESGVSAKKGQDEVNASTLSSIKYTISNMKSELDYLQIMFTTEKLQKIDETMNIVKSLR